MRHTQLTGSPLKPSVLCLGTASFGSAIRREEAWRMMDAFIDQGGNFFDTARVYAQWLPNGEGSSECTIGEWLRKHDRRQDVIVGTKGCTLELGTRQPPELSPEQIAFELGESLERLQSDYVDVYWLHRDNPSVPVAEVIDALAPHVDSGSIRALGASNWTPSRLREAAEYAHNRGLPGFRASQIGWSLAVTDGRSPGDPTMLSMDNDTYAFHLATGLPLVPFSAQAGGFFAGKGRSLREQYSDQPPPTAPGARYYCGENLRRLECAEHLARQYGVTPNSIALAYLTSQPFPVSAIVGPKTVKQVESSCEASDLCLSPDDLAFLEGRCGTGPAPGQD